MKIRVIVLPLFLGVYSIGGCGEKPHPDEAAEGEVAIDVSLPAYGDVRFVSVGDFDNRPRVDFFVRDRQGNTLYKFPEFPANREYAYDQTSSVKFEDLNDDGLKDVVIIARYVTGIGPSGAEPFDIAGFYLQREDGFEAAIELAELLNGDKYYGKWHDVEDLIKMAASHKRDGTAGRATQASP